jgi:RNA polymerase sigma-70 factor (ECF subfamily)
MLNSPEEQVKMVDIWHKYYTYFTILAEKYLSREELIEDAVSDTFMDIISNKTKLFSMDEITFKKHTTIICKNCCLNLLRKERTDILRPIDDMREFEAEDTSLFEKFESEEQLEVLKSCIKEMEFLEKTALQLHYIQGLTLRETSDKMSLDFYTLRTIIKRARTKLKILILEKSGKTLGV